MPVWPLWISTHSADGSRQDLADPRGGRAVAAVAQPAVRQEQCLVAAAETGHEDDTPTVTGTAKRPQRPAEHAGGEHGPADGPARGQHSVIHGR